MIRKLVISVGAVRPADIIFVYGKTGVREGALNVASVVAQRLLASLRKSDPVSLFQHSPTYSHVMLGLGEGLVVHADGKSVTIELASKALQESLDGSHHFRVFRHPQLHDDTRIRIADCAIRYHHKTYSLTTYFGDDSKGPRAEDEDTTQFCSKLVAYSFRAAGHPLAEMDDHRMLPLDIYRACVRQKWDDVTNQFILEEIELPPELDDIPLPGGVRASELSKRIESAFSQIGSIREAQYDQRFKLAGLLIEREGILNSLAVKKFEVARLVNLKNGLVTEEVAEWIATSLRRITEVLNTASADIENINESLLANDANELTVSLSAMYVGLPRPEALRIAQKARQKVELYTALLLIEVGLAVVLAGAGVPKVKEYRSDDAGYANIFEAALPEVDNAERFGKIESPFAWIEEDSDRAISAEMFKRILVMLQVVGILREQRRR